MPKIHTLLEPTGVLIVCSDANCTWAFLLLKGMQEAAAGAVVSQVTGVYPSLFSCLLIALCALEETKQVSWRFNDLEQQSYKTQWFSHHE